MSRTFTIPWDGRTKTFDRDRLATAVLLRLESGADNRSVYLALRDEYGVEKHEAMELSVASRICVERGLDP